MFTFVDHYKCVINEDFHGGTNNNFVIAPKEYWNFKKIDGYIDYLLFCQKMLLTEKTDPKIKEYAIKFCSMLQQLRDKNTNICHYVDEKDANYFDKYREKISMLFNKLEEKEADYEIFMSDDEAQILAFLEETDQRAPILVFDNKDEQTERNKEIRATLNEMKCAGNGKQKYQKISEHMHDAGYHEEIFVVFNTLIYGFRYLLNCQSFYDNQLHEYDIPKLEQSVIFATNTLKRIAYMQETRRPQIEEEIERV